MHLSKVLVAFIALPSILACGPEAAETANHLIGTYSNRGFGANTHDSGLRAAARSSSS